MQASHSKGGRSCFGAGYKVTSPVTHARGYMNLSESSDPKDALISQLMDRVSRLEESLRLAEGLHFPPAHRRRNALAK